MNIRKYLASHVRHLVLVILLALTFPLVTRLSFLRTEYFPTNLDRSIGLQLLTEMIGEVRISLAGVLFNKTELYHHEREGKFYWKTDPTTLPIHRLVTAMDPHNEQAYDFGAYHLAINFKKTNEGIKFLQEGLRYNPKSYKLHFTMGQILYSEGNYDSAARYFLRALSLATDPVDIKNALRLLQYSYRRQKKYDEAIRYLTMWRQLDPRDRLPHQFLEEIEQLKTGKRTEEDFRNAGMTDKEKEQHNKELREQFERRFHNHDGVHIGPSAPADDETNECNDPNCSGHHDH